MRVSLALSALIVTLVTGCDKDAQRPATQVAARVNGDEITVHQINNVLARTPNVSPELAAKAKSEILERLVGQQLAKQQALEKELDRTPQVVQAIESAKSEILARAYLEQIATSQPKPTPEEVREYYAQNPELFSQRRIFHIEELLVRASEGLAEALRNQATKTRSIQSLAAWLKSRNAEFAQNERILAAEEIPLSALRAIQETKVGELQINEGPDRLSVLRIIKSSPAPLDELTASPRVQQFLFSQRTNRAVNDAMTGLRNMAKIEYLGEFAGEPPLQTPAPVPVISPNAPTAPSTEIDKGLRGLK